MFKINIRRILLIFSVLSALSPVAMSQSDSIRTAFKIRFENNLHQLGNLYCWNDKDFYPGKVKHVSTVDFQSEFQKLNLTVFPELNEFTKDFYLFLESLSSVDKERFIRFFSYFENNFDAALKGTGLPVELKFLAPAISALNIANVSENGGAGIWQLTHFQAVLNGLEVAQLIDERLNPWISTQAFIHLMRQNFSDFSSPELAVLGYWFGNTKVKNAVSFAGEEEPLELIIDYLPESAKMNIAAFQATAVFLSVNHFMPADPFAKRNVPDTVKVSQQIHLQQLSNVLRIPLNQLEFLNPQYRFLIVPAKKKNLSLVLPENYRDDFIIWQDSVYNAVDSSLFAFTVQKIEYPPAPGRQYQGERVKNLEIEGKTKIKYILQTGDVLGIIAEKYDVQVEDLKYWNNISNERKIQAGKSLDIFVDNDKVDYYSAIQPSSKKTTAKTSITEQLKQSSSLPVLHVMNTGRKVEHTVKNGESPYTIAKKYVGVTPEDILEWNNIRDARKIQVGQKLIVYEK